MISSSTFSTSFSCKSMSISGLVISSFEVFFRKEKAPCCFVWDWIWWKLMSEVFPLVMVPWILNKIILSSRFRVFRWFMIFSLASTAFVISMDIGRVSFSWMVFFVTFVKPPSSMM